MWTLVEIFLPHTVEIFLLRLKILNVIDIFIRQFKYFYPVEIFKPITNISTLVKIYLTWWTYFYPGLNIFVPAETLSKILKLKNNNVTCGLYSNFEY